MRGSRLVGGALAVILAAACGSTTPPPPRAIPAVAPRAPEQRLAAIDLFGTEQLSVAQLMSVCGPDLEALAKGLMRGEQVDPEPALSKIRALGHFADVTPSLVGYPGSDVTEFYLTIDIVDEADAARRLAFRSTFSQTFEDPDGLLADWNDYEATTLEMIMSGTMTPKRVDCPAYHCLGDHRDAKVQTVASKMFRLAPQHAQQLADIALNDSDGRHRGAAVYLLAMSKDIDLLQRTLSLTMRDMSSLVRNNSLRVLDDIARFHPEVAIPLDAILDALEFPLTTDRNKAAATLDAIVERADAERPARVQQILRRSGRVLLAMLRLKQPNNHLFAHSILVKLAGRDLGELDYDAWDRWLTSSGY